MSGRYQTKRCYSNRILSQLYDARRHPGIWSGVPPEKADGDLRLMLDDGLVMWRGDGYAATEAGRAELDAVGFRLIGRRH